MLFYLTDSLIVDDADPHKDVIIRAVSNVANQVFDSKHDVTGDYAAIEHFREVFYSTPLIGVLFNKLFQNFATIKVPEQVTFYVEVVKDNPTTRIVDNKKIVQIDCSDLLSLDYLVETQLVCEDLGDSVFYEHILQWFLKKEQMNVSYSFHELGGGGQNSYRTVETELNKKHITLCIVDTDIRYPGDLPKEDSTYSKCKAITTDSPTYCFLPLEVHEIENLIPLNYIDIAFPIYTQNEINDRNNKQCFDYLRSNGNEILPFFDFKKGIHKTGTLLSNHNYYSFAKSCYLLNRDFMSSEADFDTYLSNIQANQIVYPQLIGGTGLCKMLKCFLGGEYGGYIPTPILFPFQEDNWVKIGRSMLNWCISRNNESM